jgi:hypothetical protein
VGERNEIASERKVTIDDDIGIAGTATPGAGSIVRHETAPSALSDSLRLVTLIASA